MPQTVTPFERTPRPTETMWGHADGADELLAGVWFVSTPGHGGIILSHDRQAAMPPKLRLNTQNYEEDCDWALVVIAFADEILATASQADLAEKTNMIEIANKTAAHWHKDRFEAFNTAKMSTSATGE